MGSLLKNDDILELSVAELQVLIAKERLYTEIIIDLVLKSADVPDNVSEQVYLLSQIKRAGVLKQVEI